MAVQDLERVLIEGSEAIEKSPEVTRRNTLMSLGLGTLSLLASSFTPFLARAEGEHHSDEKFYFEDGPNFDTHIRNDRGAGKDWFTTYGKTLITPMAEGRVVYIEKHKKYINQPVIMIEHLGGRFTEYSHLTDIFVREFDYVGRNTIMGIGGDVTDTPVRRVRRVSRPHIHVNYVMLKIIFDIGDRKNKAVPPSDERPVVLLDPEAQGQKGYGLELWKGEDLFSQYVTQSRRIIHYIDSLIPKSSKRLKDALEREAKDPHINLDNSKIIFFNTALERDAPWLTKEEKEHLRKLMSEYASLKQPLTLPFVNPTLDKNPGFYQKGSTARTLEEFTKQYASTMQLLK